MFGELLLAMLFLPDPHRNVAVPRDRTDEETNILAEDVDLPRPSLPPGLSDFVWLSGKCWEARRGKESVRELQELVRSKRTHDRR